MPKQIKELFYVNCNVNLVNVNSTIVYKTWF